MKTRKSEQNISQRKVYVKILLYSKGQWKPLLQQSCLIVVIVQKEGYMTSLSMQQMGRTSSGALALHGRDMMMPKI